MEIVVGKRQIGGEAKRYRDDLIFTYTGGPSMKLGRLIEYEGNPFKIVEETSTGGTIRIVAEPIKQKRGAKRNGRI